MASILIIDPNYELRAFIADVLATAGHDVTEASDAVGGGALMRREPVQLVVSDLAPTGRNYCTICTAALRNEFPEVEFVALAESSHATSCLRLNACLSGRRTPARPFSDRARMALVHELVTGVAAYRAHAEYQASRLALAE